MLVLVPGFGIGLVRVRVVGIVVVRVIGFGLVMVGALVNGIKRVARRVAPWYTGTMVTKKKRSVAGPIRVERVQTGVRMEKRIVRVLKAVAELHDMSLGDLLEGIVLHAFEGKCAFGPQTLERIAELRRIYRLDLDARASHRMQEKP